VFLCIQLQYNKQESPADAGIPARRKNDEKNASISKL